MAPRENRELGSFSKMRKHLCYVCKHYKQTWFNYGGLSFMFVFHRGDKFEEISVLCKSMCCFKLWGDAFQTTEKLQCGQSFPHLVLSMQSRSHLLFSFPLTGCFICFRQLVRFALETGGDIKQRCFLNSCDLRQCNGVIRLCRADHFGGRTTA